MERVDWQPLHYKKPGSERLATCCYTLLAVALVAGTVAVVVSWLLATGVITPAGEELPNFREEKKIHWDETRLNRLQHKVETIEKKLSLSGGGKAEDPTDSEDDQRNVSPKFITMQYVTEATLKASVPEEGEGVTMTMTSPPTKHNERETTLKQDMMEDSTVVVVEALEEATAQPAAENITVDNAKEETEPKQDTDHTETEDEPKLETDQALTTVTVVPVTNSLPAVTKPQPDISTDVTEQVTGDTAETSGEATDETEDDADAPDE